MKDTIYTDKSGAQGFLTALILMPDNDKKPSEMCFYETFNEMHLAVKEQYGQNARYIGMAEFKVEMAHRGMSYMASEGMYEAEQEMQSLDQQIDPDGLDEQGQEAWLSFILDGQEPF